MYDDIIWIYSFSGTYLLPLLLDFAKSKASLFYLGRARARMTKDLQPFILQDLQPFKNKLQVCSKNKKMLHDI